MPLPEKASKKAPIWGYLQPLLDEEEIDHYSLPLPGSYGREALIRPFLDSCSCRKRNVPTKRPRCDNCKSVRLLATYIPRKHLLRFSYSNNKCWLEISGNNSMQLVHLLRHEATSSDNLDQFSEGLVSVKNEDLIALKYEGVNVANSAFTESNVQSLVRFRAVQIKMTDSLREKPTGKNPERLERGGVQIPSSDDKCKIILDDQDDRWMNAELSLRTPTATAAAVKSIHKASYLNGNKNHTIDSGHEREQTIAAANAKTSHPLNTTTQDQNSENEEETPTQVESAPLTIPMNFHPETSDSYEQSSEVNIDVSLLSETTPQKSNIPMKRKFANQHCDHSECNAAITVAKDLEREASESNQSSVPISSLSYHQIQQLHQKSNDIHNIQQPSVRNAVLSLTLALTSSTSAWDSTSLDACTVKKAELDKKPEKWMPRLLHGAKVML